MKNNILPKRRTVYKDFNLGAWFSTQKMNTLPDNLAKKE